MSCWLLERRAKLDGNEELAKFVQDLEAATLSTMEAGAHPVPLPDPCKSFAVPYSIRPCGLYCGPGRLSSPGWGCGTLRHS